MARSRVFISYAREDRAAARRLCDSLREEGLEVWFDEDSLIAGQRWFPTITKAINACDFFIALLSSASVNKRGVVQKEIREALKVVDTLPNDHIFVLPVRLDDCQPSFEYLKEINWIDIFVDWDRGIRAIVRATLIDSGDIDRTGETTPFEERAVHDVSSTPSPSYVRVSEALHEALDQFKEYANYRNLEFRLRDQSKGSTVEIDAFKLQQVLLNLLHNATKFSYSPTGSQSWVSVDATLSENQVEIKVQNWGMPIGQDEITTGRIFQQGYRSKHSDSVAGEGLGLAVARDVLLQYGGKLTLDSKPSRSRKGKPDQASPYVTEFVIQLPKSIKDDD